MFTLLQTTSLSFLLVIFYAQLCNQPRLMFSWTFLLITSILYHNQDSYQSKTILFWIDQIAIYLVTIIGATYFTSSPPLHKFVMLLTFLFTLFIYWVSKATKKWICDSNNSVAEKWHACLYSISVIGHLFILHGTTTFI